MELKPTGGKSSQNNYFLFLCNLTIRSVIFFHSHHQCIERVFSSVFCFLRQWAEEGNKLSKIKVKSIYTMSCSYMYTLVNILHNNKTFLAQIVIGKNVI